MVGSLALPDAGAPCVEPPAEGVALMDTTSASSTSLTPLTQHICSPECSDCFRRRVCRDGHDYTDAMPATVTVPPIGLAYERPSLTLFCRRCGDIR